MAAVPLPPKTSVQLAQAFHQAFGFDGVEVIRADHGREFEGLFEKEAAKHHVKIDVSVQHRAQTHARSERFNQELENAVRTSLYQSGLPYAFGRKPSAWPQKTSTTQRTWTRHRRTRSALENPR